MVKEASMNKKATNMWFRIIVGTFICALLTPAFGLAQKDNKDQKKQEKEAKDNAKDESRLDKNVKKYEESLAKANEKYGKDDDFRDEVEFQYKELQRDH